jgi:hypothetical protein
MQQLAYARATLVEDGERVFDEVGYAEVRFPWASRLR